MLKRHFFKNPLDHACLSSIFMGALHSPPAKKNTQTIYSSSQVVALNDDTNKNDHQLDATRIVHFQRFTHQALLPFVGLVFDPGGGSPVAGRVYDGPLWL